MEKTEKAVDEVATSLSDGDQQVPVHIDPAVEKRIVRKIDRVVLPLMCTAVAYAAVFGLREALHLTSNEFMGRQFLLGQLGWEYIFIYIMIRFLLGTCEGAVSPAFVIIKQLVQETGAPHPSRAGNIGVAVISASNNLGVVISPDAYKQHLTRHGRAGRSVPSRCVWLD
ncbi:uncharacterized protein DSM5745_11206 [Aspergillus mulundensis]|uniref:Uncharacterized protein n=1 Tax=Aspergillus mulundensis TaxID=1810919 RepID=A0A3D8QBH1_9EURO|nr:hypothetical protein DSM5745_11206 [Aspergillus mulundensis]RDW59000.1 hypothetical protein DSM5745_11206 [Aspergillus mulundensis]